MNKIYVFLSCAFAIVAITAFTTVKQDQQPLNLKVLPKNISKEELDKTMKSFNAALGVKCNFCHAPKADGQPGLDFASDANHHKAIARSMIKMTQKINKKHFQHKDKEGLLKQIDCATCHNGQAEPKTIRI